MGGCCCCLSKDVEPQRLSEEAVPLSSQHGSAPAVSSGLLANTTDLETSVVNTYMPPPAPVWNNVVVDHFQTRDSVVESGGNKTEISSLQTANSISVEELVRVNHQKHAEKDEHPKLSECKDLTPIVSEKENECDIEHSKHVDPVIVSVEECPTCLEEYDEDNPKITAKCIHHFHLACILEWMERSDTCPVCNNEMIFSPPIN